MATPTDRPCPLYPRCDGFLNSDNVCPECGAVAKSSEEILASWDRAEDVGALGDDDDFEEPEWHGGYTDADLDVLADEAADHHYDRD